MKNIIISMGISFACLALVACAASSTSRGSELTGTIWILTELNGNPPVAGSSITAIFTQEGKISGSAGCNQYLGSYRISGNTISISGTLATTLMMCKTSLMIQETAYLEALQEAKSYTTTGDQLSLINADNAVSAVFKAQKQDLLGTSWEVISYNNGKQAVTSVLAGTSLTADFGADGKFSGKSGCNSYSGSYKVEGSKISIGPIASTKMYCNEPAGVMEQETQYLLALESAATYRIEGNSLELRTQDGALAVQLASK